VLLILLRKSFVLVSFWLSLLLLLPPPPHTHTPHIHSYDAWSLGATLLEIYTGTPHALTDPTFENALISLCLFDSYDEISRLKFLLNEEHEDGEENKKKITVRKRCDADTFRQRLIRLFRNDDDDEDDDYEEDRLLVDLIYRLLDPNPKSRMHVNRVQNDHAYVCVTHSLFSLLSQLIQIATLVQVLQWTVSLEKQNFYN
jgi:hypothetical protein